MSHRCEWCEMTADELRIEISLYTQIIEEADAKLEELGGSIRCKPEDRDEVDRLESDASGHEDDRYFMRECMRSRRIQEELS